MYNFIYYVLYNQQKQKGRSESYSRFHGSMPTWFAMFVHIILLFEVIKKILLVYYNIAIPRKYLVFVYFLPGPMYLTSFWYRSNKITKKIMDKFLTDKDPARDSNLFKVEALIFVPIIVFFILS